MPSSVSRSAPTYASAARGDQTSPAPPAAAWSTSSSPSPTGSGVTSSVKVVSASEAARSSPATDSDADAWPRNPHLTQPKLYMSHLGANVTKRSLAHDVFNHCLPVKFELDDLVDPNMATGIVHFSHLSNGACVAAAMLAVRVCAENELANNVICAAELAYATIDVPMLSINAPSGETSDPPAQSKRRLINQLPQQITVAEVFRLLRPFGALRKVTLITTSAKTGQSIGFRGSATVEYYSEDDARVAERALHCSDVGGNSISVTIDTLNRAPAAHSIRATAPVFVPRLMIPRSAGAQASAFASPPSPTPACNNPASPLSMFEFGGGYASMPETPMTPLTPALRTKLIDPCNLFVKHLAPSVSSSDLYKAFTPFGDIVSARVMRDDDGNSRLFGFVSYKQADEAAEALRHMHRSRLDGHPITVSLHQPKMQRQEKLARSASVSAGSAYRPPGRAAAVMFAGDPDGPEGPPNTPALRTPGLQRKKSNSYFRDAMEADLRGEQYTFGQLAALSSSVRNEVLAGLLARRLKKLPGFDVIAAEEGVQHTETPEEAKTRRQALLTRAAHGGSAEHGDENIVANNRHPSRPAAPAPINWTDEEVQQIVEEMVAKIPLSEAVEALDNPAVLLEHALRHANTVTVDMDLPFPQPGSLVPGGIPLAVPMPAPMPAPMSVRPRSATTGTPGAALDLTTSLAPAPVVEADRLLLSVRSLGMPLSEATVRDITDLLNGLPKKERALCLFNRDVLAQKVQEARDILSLTDDDEVFSSSFEPSSGESVETLLTSIPSHELLHRLQSGALAPAYLPAPKEEWAATESYVASLHLLSVTEAKQHLGARLFSIIKMAGIRGAAKLTIVLLDSEDLQVLAHLADSFPTILQEKAIKLQS